MSKALDSTYSGPSNTVPQFQHTLADRHSFVFSTILTSTPKRAMAATSRAMRITISGSTLLLLSPAKASPLILRSTRFHFGLDISEEANGELGAAASSNLETRENSFQGPFDELVV
jgi:hypothetical protein